MKVHIEGRRVAAPEGRPSWLDRRRAQAADGIGKALQSAGVSAHHEGVRGQLRARDRTLLRVRLPNSPLPTQRRRTPRNNARVMAIVNGILTVIDDSIAFSNRSWRAQNRQQVGLIIVHIGLQLQFSPWPLQRRKLLGWRQHLRRRPTLWGRARDLSRRPRRGMKTFFDASRY